MSKFIETYKSELLRFDDPFAYINLTDFGNGKGLMQIHSDYGVYSYFWGGMGKDIKILEFIASTNHSYIHDKLTECISYQSMRRDAQVRLKMFMIKCWPEIHEKIKKLVENDESDNGV